MKWVQNACHPAGGMIQTIYYTGMRLVDDGCLGKQN